MKQMFLVTGVLVATLSGCAGPTVYGKPGNTVAQEQKDFAECRFEAAFGHILTKR